MKYVHPRLFDSHKLYMTCYRKMCVLFLSTTSIRNIFFFDKYSASYVKHARAGITHSLQQLGYGLDNREVGIRFPVGERNFVLLHNVQVGSGVPRPLSPEIKRQGHANLKNGGTLISTPPPVFMAWCLIKSTDSFTFYSRDACRNICKSLCKVSVIVRF